MNIYSKLKTMLRKNQPSEPATNPVLLKTAVFTLTASLLSFVQLRVDPPMLIVERFFPGWGWFEILALSLYAGFIAGKMLNPTLAPRWRLRIWILFSVAFFSQLLIGLLGVDQFLMTGTLHIPVPAMIVAGPLFRAARFFMPILFASTVLLVGPAWCSHLCYIGAWDAAAAIQNRTPGKTCTLCGDCIKSCKDQWIEYRFFNMSPERARKLFIVLIVSLHAVFLGVARI